MNEFISIPGITIICYLIAEFWKKLFPKWDKYIPCLCGFVGGLLGLLVFFTIPDLKIASNWLGAVGTGIFSGFAATGCNQVYKQLTK